MLIWVSRTTKKAPFLVAAARVYGGQSTTAMTDAERASHRPRFAERASMPAVAVVTCELRLGVRRDDRRDEKCKTETETCGVTGVSRGSQL